MKRGYLSVGTLLIIVLTMAAASGCSFVRRPGQLQTETEAVELGGAERVAVQLQMGGGKLIVDGGADALMEAMPRWSSLFKAAWERSTSTSWSDPL